MGKSKETTGRSKQGQISRTGHITKGIATTSRGNMQTTDNHFQRITEKENSPKAMENSMDNSNLQARKQGHSRKLQACKPHIHNT